MLSDLIDLNSSFSCMLCLLIISSNLVLVMSMLDHLVKLENKNCVSTALCSGGPKYASSVAILSKGLLPMALWSLEEER